MPISDARTQLRTELYEAALQSKHHYDTLSWVIAGAVFLAMGALAAYVLELQAPSYRELVIRRLPAALFGIALAYLWDGVYHRNRFWAEVANEKLREFERSIGEEGISLAFMKANHSGEVVLRNVDEGGRSVTEPHTERCRQGPMHGGVARISLLFKVALVLALFLPW